MTEEELVAEYDIPSPKEYLKKLNMRGSKMIAYDNAVALMNEHTVAYYKGRVRLIEKRAYSAMELADKLYMIHVSMCKGIHEAIEEIENEDAV